MLYSFGDKVIAGLIGAVLVGLVGLIVWSIAREAYHGGCVERRQTGALTCYGSETYKRCEPETACVRFADGTTP
jgi:hypothetical protein